MNKIKEFFQKMRQFFADVREELRKSAWPTRNELLESTAVLVTAVIMFSVFVGLSDFVLVKVLGLLVR